MVWSSGKRMVTPSGTLMFEVLSESPIASSLISASTKAGIFSGRQRTGTRRKICWRMPPSATPLALPMRWNGNLRTSTGFVEVHLHEVGVGELGA